MQTEGSNLIFCMVLLVSLHLSLKCDFLVQSDRSFWCLSFVSARSGLWPGLNLLKNDDVFQGKDYKIDVSLSFSLRHRIKTSLAKSSLAQSQASGMWFQDGLPKDGLKIGQAAHDTLSSPDVISIMNDPWSALIKGGGDEITFLFLLKIFGKNNYVFIICVKGEM